MSEVDASDSDSSGEESWLPPANSLIVQKFGGSSVRDASCIRNVAQRLASAHLAGHKVVGVVSAMGHTTDELLKLAQHVSPRPRQRYVDALLTTGELIPMTLLAIALADLGLKVRTFTGGQAGLVTDHLYGHAHILDVRPDHVRACVDRGGIAIVAGFQGYARKKKRNLTTLGRGGSDLTAVALAAALGASVCEIYTDVDGVFTADPRVVPTARKIEALSSAEMLEFAASGAGVLHLRSVEYARRFNVPLHVRSSFNHNPGTLVLPHLDGHRDTSARERPIVSAVTGSNSAAAITVVDVPARPEATARIFEDLAKAGLSINSITQSVHPSNRSTSNVVFALPASEAPTALVALGASRASVGFRYVQVRGRMGQITVSGLGLRSSADMVYAFLKALSDADIRVELMETSELSISAVIPAELLEEAVTRVEAAFGLAKPPGKTPLPPERFALNGGIHALKHA